MKRTTKENLIVFVLCLLLLVGSATGSYIGCTLAYRDCCPAAKPAACSPQPPSPTSAKDCVCCHCDQCCGCALVQIDGQAKSCGCCKSCPGRKPRDDPKKCSPDPLPPAK